MIISPRLVGDNPLEGLEPPGMDASFGVGFGATLDTRRLRRRIPTRGVQVGVSTAGGEEDLGKI